MHVLYKLMQIAQENWPVPAKVLCLPHLEGDGLVWFGSKQKILPLSIRGLQPLLVGGHEPMSWPHALCYLRVVNLR